LYQLRAEYPYVLSSVLIVVVMLSVMANRGLRHSLRSDAV
jgi:hypothetical protein